MEEKDKVVKLYSTHIAVFTFISAVLWSNHEFLRIKFIQLVKDKDKAISDYLWRYKNKKHKTFSVQYNSCISRWILLDANCWKTTSKAIPICIYEEKTKVKISTDALGW